MSVTVYVNNDSNDGNQGESGASVISTSSFVFGDAGNPTYGYATLANLSIGRGQVVDSASFNFTLSANFQVTQAKIYAIYTASTGNAPVDGSGVSTLSNTNLITDYAAGNPTKLATTAYTLKTISGTGAVTVDVTAILQELVNLSVWSSGNSVCFVICNGPSQTYPYNLGTVTDYPTTPANLEYNLSTYPVIAGPSDDYVCSSVGNVFTGYNLSSATSVTLIGRGVSEPQTITASTSTSITINNVPGQVPYGSCVLRVSDGTHTNDFPVTYVPVSGNGYVVGADIISDTTSVFYGTTPSATDGDVIEWQEASVWTAYPRGNFTRVSGSSDTTFVYRLWLSGASSFTDWATITISSYSSVNATPSVGSVSFSGNTPTVVITANKIFSPTVGALSFVGNTPSVAITANVNFAPSQGSITYTGNIPVLTTGNGTIALPSSGAISFDGGSPTLLVSNNVTTNPSQGSVIYQGGSPSVSITQNITVTPTSGVITYVGGIPTVAANVTFSPTTGGISYVGGTPTITSHPALPTIIKYIDLIFYI